MTEATQNAITKRAGIVGLGTMLSRILGLVRESVIAALFPKEAIDAYQVAFMIPNTFRRLTAEGSFSISVVSVFSKIWGNSDAERTQARIFARALYGFALLFLGGLTILGVYGAELLTLIGGHGFLEHPGKFELATSLTRTMFPYIFFISLTSLAMGILNSAGKFFAPAFAPVLLNVSIIGCAVGFTGVMPQWDLSPIFALAFGVLLGGVLQLLFQLPDLKRLGLLVVPRMDLKHPGLMRVLKMSGGMIFGVAAYQISQFLSYALASHLGHGAVTYITFANRVTELPLAVLVMAISTAALPSLAALGGAQKMDELKETFRRSLKLALFLATPAAVGLIVLAQPVATILYQRGLFSYDDAVQTAAGLRWLAAGICSVALLRQTIPVFYALERVKIPVVMAFVFLGAYAIAAVSLMGSLRHVGLCMATSIGATAQALGLVIMLRRYLGRLELAEALRSWTMVLLATVPCGVVAWAVAHLGVWEDGGNSPRNIGVLVLAVAGGGMAYLGAARLLKLNELMELLAAVRRRRGGK